MKAYVRSLWNRYKERPVTYIVLAFVVSAIALMIASAVSAQEPPGVEFRTVEAVCFPAAGVASSLANEFGERPVIRGVTNVGNLLVVTANPSTGSWTALLIPDRQTACIVVAGVGLQMANAPPGPTREATE
jgi:peptidoglycan/LPS O-acetylase OafA/YrhL